MKKYLLFFVGVCMAMNANAGVVLSDTSVSDGDYVQEESYSSSTGNNYYRGDLLSTDSSDPLFLVADNSFLSNTGVFYFDDIMNFGQSLAYGVNRVLAIYANANYQLDFRHDRGNGFAATEFGGIYRMNEGDGPLQLMSDLIFGFRGGGSSHVKTPIYAKSSYFAGLRFGHQFTAVTLASTVKSTWVFDDTRGLSYINFMPEMYFRFKYDLRASIGADFRKSTNKYLLSNQEWMNFKLIRQFGNTQYVANLGYEFEEEEYKVGMDIKILF